ncbi:hypothetical protein [Asticcacaulis taihuensis]|uniref:Copper resistance protein D n=1 Tax=Asticcacaulis taihuensis TaxID=260084 RepID=A0A1G4TQB5_9CAUL|nr:hypothetical protein [Asticcacaulis taihuensis]SCW83586.1 hypothetical protein SAMN02927928_0079 [Asticcacaulis taihuensis]
MQILIILALSLHVLAAIFWMATTGMLARAGGMGAETLFPRQIIAVVLVVLTGGYLWSQLHTGGFGTYEKVLAAGAACAILAAGIQSIGVGVSLRALKGDQGAGARKRIAAIHRIAAPLLGICLLCMVLARYI